MPSVAQVLFSGKDKAKNRCGLAEKPGSTDTAGEVPRHFFLVAPYLKGKEILAMPFDDYDTCASVEELESWYEEWFEYLRENEYYDD